MGKIKYIGKDFNERRKSAFSSSLWPIYYQLHLNLAVGHVSFYTTPLSDEELSCRLRAVCQIKRLPQDAGGLQSHWSLFVSLFCFSLQGFFTFLPPLAASSLQLFYFSVIMLFFSFSLGVYAGIFLLKVHSTVQFKTRAALQQSWTWFPHSTFEYCLTVKRYPQRWHFTYRQLISEKLSVLSLAQELVKGGWKAVYQRLLFSPEYCSITLRLKVQFAKVRFKQHRDVHMQMAT